MVDVPIQLAAIWVALMLVYQLGVVQQFTRPMWLGSASLMVMPIVVGRVFNV